MKQLAKRTAITFILIYRFSASYFFGGQCKFYPSCSAYALDCYNSLDFFSATKLVIKRLLSCHPLSRKSGFDPAPILNKAHPKSDF